METLIGIVIGLLFAFVFWPQMWRRLLKEPLTRAWKWVKSVDEDKS